MRTLVYVGINRVEDEKVETTSYEKMLEYKSQGFTFTTRLDDIVKEREPLANYRARMAERDRQIRAKRAAAAI